MNTRIFILFLGVLALLCCCVDSAAALEPPEFLLTWGSNGTAAGDFRRPWGIAVDGNGIVYVADSDNDRIQKFDALGTYLLEWGSVGTAAGEFRRPDGVAVDDSGYVYVADYDNDRIQKFDGTGSHVLEWGSTGSGNGQFRRPRGVAVDNSGYVYVSEQDNDRIQKFNSSGVFLLTWGSNGTGDGQFTDPHGIAVDADGDLYVADAGNDRIQKFNSTGLFLAKWGVNGTNDGEFRNPHDVAFDSVQRVYVTDFDNNRIQMFDQVGTFLAAWGTNGNGDGMFLGPHGIAIDSADHLFVTDENNHRVQVFIVSSVSPMIQSIADIGNDQGRQVRVDFTADSHDVAGSASAVLQYECFRRIDTLPMAPFGGESPFAGAAAQTMLLGWEFVGAVPAHAESVYSMVVPTLADSTINQGMQWSVFFVRAATGLPGTFFDSEPDSGYSVDNLSPAEPGGLAGSYGGDTTPYVWGTTLTWDSNQEADFFAYRLYRGESEAFVPGPGNLLASQYVEGYFDPGLPGGYYYKLAAVDHNGNVSPYAVLAPQDITGVPDEFVLTFALRVIENPVTARSVRVSFELPDDVPATLDLYDLAGRLVARRDVTGIGRRTVDLAGDRPLASGMYLVRLTQGVYTRTDRVVVVQ